LFFDEVDVVLGVSGELVERSASGDVFSPSGEVLVDGLASCEVIDNRGERSFKFLSIELVVGGDLDGGDAGKDIKLGNVQGREAIKFVGVLDDVEIEPSALSLATGGGTELVSDILKSFTDLVVEPCGERSSSDTSGVSLYDTDVAIESRWWDTESSADSSDTSAGRGNIRPGSEVEIEHGGVGSLSNDTLGRIVEVRAHVIDGVNEHSVLGAIELLGHLEELVKLFFAVKVSDVELVLEPINEGVVLLLEERPVSEISSAETDSESLGGVSWADTLLGGADHVTLGFLESALLIHTVSLHLNFRDEMSSG